LEPLLQYRIQIVRKLPTVFLLKCFRARALSKSQIFKSHLVKRTAVPSADGHKDSSFCLTYFANEFFHEVGNVDLSDMMVAENPKNENVQSF
jgi:hypothetical protein